MNIRIASRSLIAIPLLWLMSMYICWIGATKSLGRYPRPAWDDPKGIEGTWRGLYSASWTFYSPGLPVFLVASAGLIAYLLINRTKGWRAGLVETITAITFMIGLIFFSGNWFEFVRWYFD